MQSQARRKPPGESKAAEMPHIVRTSLHMNNIDFQIDFITLA
jgi:hypothetical protein